MAWIYLAGFIALPVLSKSFETLAVCQWCVKQNATIGKEIRYYKQHNVDVFFFLHQYHQDLIVSSDEKEPV